MFKKKRLFVLFLLMLLAAGAVWLFNPFGERVRSKILVDKGSVTTTEDGSTIYRIPIAALPEPEDSRNWELLEGKVVKIPNVSADAKSNALIAVEKGKDLIAVANLPYVHSLEYFYLGKNVRLRGVAKKDAVIYGRSYKLFWVEDIELNEPQARKK